MRSLRARKKPVRYAEKDDDEGASSSEASNDALRYEDDDVSSAEMEEPPVQQRSVANKSSAITAQRTRSNMKQESSDDEDTKPNAVASNKEQELSDDDKSTEVVQQTESKTATSSTNSTKRANKTTRKVKATSTRKVKPKCPYCNKAFSVASRLNYHVNNFVCRPKLKDEMETEASLSKTEGDSDEEMNESNNPSQQDKGVQVDEEGNPFCPHCMIAFATIEEAQDHVQQSVCRPLAIEAKEKAPKSPKRTTSSRKRKRAKGSTSAKKKSRGAEEDRTCPTCNRIFTSVPGLQYHVSKFVFSFVLPF